MKNYLMISFLFLMVWGNLNAQVYDQPDQNKFLEEKTDKEFNAEQNMILVDYTFIKSPIGINLDSIVDFKKISPPFTIRGINDGDSIVLTKDTPFPVVINGVKYYRFFNVTFDKEITLVTLDEIREEYCPDLKGPYLFMVNKFFLTNDLESYKFDKEFILDVEVLQSEEFESFEEFQPFSIIRIFTKTRTNLKNHNAKRLQ